jgi:hypothetical protein
MRPPKRLYIECIKLISGPLGAGPRREVWVVWLYGGKFHDIHKSSSQKLKQKAREDKLLSENVN